LEAFMRVAVLVLTCTLIVACSRTTEPAKQASTTVGTVRVEDDDDSPDGVLVTQPAEGSPEAVLQTLIAAAMNPDEAAGWGAVRSMLHSSIRSAHALQSYRQMNFQASRRKVALFTPDDTVPHFWVVRRTTPGPDKLKLFVHNERSMPTPCILRRDEDAEGAWRVYVCSL
jgi:hypothetical protein